MDADPAEVNKTSQPTLAPSSEAAAGGNRPVLNNRINQPTTCRRRLRGARSVSIPALPLTRINHGPVRFHFQT
jgi:hypothetical protein